MKTAVPVKVRRCSLMWTKRLFFLETLRGVQLEITEHRANFLAHACGGRKILNKVKEEREPPQAFKKLSEVRIISLSGTGLKKNEPELLLALRDLRRDIRGHLFVV
jgi:hypothetical protein